MTKWEYCVVLAYFSWRPNDEPLLTVGSINGKPVKVQDIHDLANELGVQGWELMKMEALETSSRHPTSCWVFKRPRP